MLPTLPNRQTATRNQEVAFRGLNLSENTQDGDLRDSSGLSTQYFPCITQRRRRGTLTGYSNPTDIFEWDGKIICVDGANLLYDGNIVGNVTPGKKQFAVVNTKLIVWPDETYLDLVNMEYKPLHRSVNSAGTTIFDSSSAIRVPTTSSVIGTMSEAKTASVQYIEYHFWDITGDAIMYKTYNSIRWENGHIVAEGEVEKGVAEQTQYYLPQISVGDKIRLLHSNISGSYTLNSRRITYHNKEPSGYREITSDTGYGTDSPYYYAEVTSVNYTSTSPYTNYYEFHMSLGLNVIDARSSSIVFTTVFKVGDKLRISGCTTLPQNNTEGVVTVSAVTSNSITFSDASFTAGNEAGAVIIETPIPHMDYICERDNRLWGVSNSAENTIYDPQTQKRSTVNARAIYASALGLPDHFEDFEGVDTDSYAVAVGSEGDFTGICNYNGVCCWKENRLHKMFGRFPSEYYLNEYEIPGVQNGSARSMKIINEVLYYNGVFGVYAFNGNTPTLISYNLGRKRLTDANGGTDGIRYYISAKREGADVLYTYDTMHGLWLKDSDAYAEAFATIGGDLHLLIRNQVLKYDDNVNELIPWSAEFVPFTEQNFNRRNYIRLLMRIDMESNSSISVSVKYDRGEWINVFSRNADASVTFTIPIPSNRCDRFAVKMSGTGEVTIRSIAREYTGGSIHD